MRKLRFFLLSVLLLLCLEAGSLAADVYAVYSLPEASASLSIAESYIVLTPENLGSHTELLASLGLEADALLEDWDARGVRLQAWTAQSDACLEVRLVQDEAATTWFDLDQQNNAARATYRSSHLKNAEWIALGYDIKSAEWKKQTNGGRFLRLKYKRTVDGRTYWGYAAKAVRNGWTLILDYQVYDRGLKAKDETSLNKVANSVTFSKVDTAPGLASGALVQFTTVPPAETNTGSFTVEGTCPANCHLIGVIMRYASPTPTRIETDATKAGKFKMKVQLPQEGIWLMTMTVEQNGTVIREEVFDTTTYQATLLPLNLDAQVPEQFGGDEFVLSGTTSKGVTIQCLVSGGGKDFNKTIRTNASGKFTFKIPTSVEAEYSITLVLQKKHYDTRRFTWTANRIITEADQQQKWREEAIKPAYSTLTRKLEGYTGRVMGYKVTVVDIQHAGDQWLVFAALSKTSKGVPKNIIVIVTDEEPTFATGTEQKMYGTCTGTYEVQSEEGVETYPSFDLLFWDTV